MRALGLACLLLLSAGPVAGQLFIEARIRTDSGPCAVAVNPRRNRVYVGDNFIFRTQGAVEVIDAVANGVVRTVRSGYFCNKVLFNPVANKAYGNMQISGLVVIDGEVDSLVGTVSVGATINEWCLDTIGNRLYLQDCVVPSTLFVLDCATDTLLEARFTIRRFGRGLFCNAPGRRTYCLDDSSRLLVIDADSLVIVDTVAVSPGAEEMAYSPTSNRLFLASYTGGTVDVIDCAADSLVATIRLTGPRRMLWQPRDNQLYVCRYLENSLAVIDCAAATVRDYIHVGGWQEQACYVPTTHAVFCITETGVAAIDCATRTVRASVNLGRMAQDIAWSPYLDRLYLPNLGNEVVVIRELAPGVAEDRSTRNSPRTLSAATIVRGVLCISRQLTADGSRQELLDALGRRVLSLRPGPNDVSSLAPGVYFVKSATGIRQSPPAPVVITR